MNTRKSIDRLYRNKFEGAEVTPPADAWQNISSKLPEKDKRSILPLWVRYAGAAAVLLVLLSLGNSFFATGPERASVSTSVTREDIHAEIRLSLADFNETMLKASMSLQEIMRWEGTSVNASSEESSRNRSMVLSEAESAPEQNLVDETELVFESSIPEAFDAVIPKEKESDLAVKETFSEEIASEENAIAQQLAEELPVSEAESKAVAGGRMSISTRLAPVFYENMGSGNGIGAGNAGGQPSGEVSLSYGVNLAYQVSDRLKLRSGINKLDLSFSTPGVAMASVMHSEATIGKSDPTLMARPVEGELTQQMDFIELPLELEYRLLDTRLGLNLIAGGSTLVLNSNNVSMNTGARTTDLGQAENMEKLNFSANLGLGLDYRLGNRLQLNLEPMFKYQLNSFTSEMGIRPYYLAVYSGFTVSF